ncbi:hypothetical protein QOZ80_1AG0033220 [Eleusine coracana subsp. coracana]|nr:hypothetical protein QOZ80_1AG0033220 [Eleusine coracana subsp. coracana]
MEHEEMSKVSEANGKVDSMFTVEAQAIKGKRYEIVEGKVDWRGKPALRGRHGGVANSFFILANFGLENLASLSLAVNLIMYFLTVMYIDLADASNLLTNYMGTSYMVAVLISVFADTFVGRYMTVIISCLVEVVGLLLLTLQAHSDRLKPPVCLTFPLGCQRVHGDNKVHLYVALYLIAIGSAGIKAALPAHCADQFDEKHPVEKLQMSSCFNWLLLSLCTGGAVSCTVFVWIQNYKGWDKGFGAATGVMGFALLVFVAGLPKYRFATVQGSAALLEIFQVYVAALRNRNLELPENPDELYEISKTKASPQTEFVAHRDKPFRFLDKAAIIHAPNDATPPSPWRQCRVTQVEHAKTVLAMVPIFCSAIIMGTCLAQLQTFSIAQGATMDTRLGPRFKMPPASLPIIPLGILIFAVPIYERLFVPFARRVTGIPTGIPYLQRVGVGLVLSIISMVIAALVEVKRKRVAVRTGKLDLFPGQFLPISCFWLAPQFAIFGIADMFTYVGLLEFFYSQAPQALKSMSSSFLWCSLSFGYFFSTIIVQVVNAATKKYTASRGWLAGNNINRNHLDLFFWLLAVLSTLNFFNYLFWSSWYKYKPREEEAVAAESEERQEV